MFHVKWIVLEEWQSIFHSLIEVKTVYGRASWRKGGQDDGWSIPKKMDENCCREVNDSWQGTTRHAMIKMCLSSCSWFEWWQTKPSTPSVSCYNAQPNEKWLASHTTWKCVSCFSIAITGDCDNRFSMHPYERSHSASLHKKSRFFSQRERWTVI